ncbi:type II toxin-antitoxin system VapC family toxin [Ramlibacter albus]|uniref:Type II toxin-antitoxin system VapC family toxin n=1 Tax=Ramlibacter albus TaxID=2079448 RepID=A0A923M7M1_9BURK|nr:type II toxin-antitoxin system VapC family toxin [Ramlibacter albus]MBC5764368.1 type II toxin-antitoxin system VapC family toxin [Ramlibacter albus]
MVKATVIDASAAAAWVIPDEANDAAKQLFAHACLDDSGFSAPTLWQWEMGNMLLQAQRRQRIAAGAPELALQTLALVQMQFDPAPDLHRQSQIMRLAQTHQLTYYDATYLELVLRLNGQLASRDDKLVAAARTCGIVCLSF